jgi:hypothetical protein
MAEAIEQLVSATVASLRASDVDHLDGGVSRRGKPAQPPAANLVRRRKEDSAS